MSVARRKDCDAGPLLGWSSRGWPVGKDSRRLRVIIILFAVALNAGARAEAPVTITGGADPSGHQYEWIVANHGESPIVYVEFPHYHGALFFAPDGWHTECTFLVNVGVKDKPGTCKAWVDSPTDGIGCPESAKFSMQIGTPAARRGPGEVVVKRANGQQITVGGVELSQAESVSDKYVSLIGLGVVLFVAVAIQRIFRKKRIG